MKNNINFEKFTKDIQVDMREEGEFREKIKEVLSHKMIAMPYSPLNDQAGIFLSQFSKVEAPEEIFSGEFRLFSSFEGTEDKNVNLVGCEVAKYGEGFKKSRFKKCPKMLSVKKNGAKCDVFRLLAKGCFEFALPVRASEESPYVISPITTFEETIDSLSYELYPKFLEKNGFIDNTSSRKSFFNFLQECDAMEFVESIKPGANRKIAFLTNHSDLHKNIENGENYKTYCVLFHRFSRNEKPEVTRAIREANRKCELQVNEKLAEKVKEN